jgi:hypothetical protein
MSAVRSLLAGEREERGGGLQWSDNFSYRTDAGFTAVHRRLNSCYVSFMAHFNIILLCVPLMVWFSMADTTKLKIVKWESVQFS